MNVTPSPTTRFVVETLDPPPPALPGDTLNVNLAGTTGGVLTATAIPSGYFGSYTFTNRASVDFFQIETLTSLPDAAVAVTDNAATATAGTAVSYTITASAPGNLAASGVQLTNAFPPSLTGVTWTCSASGTSGCGAASG